MAIGFDTSGTATGNAVTTLTVDLTGAAVGAAAYCVVSIATGEPLGLTFAGWSKLVDSDEALSSHYALYRRVKQVGDTTFALSWANAQGAAAAWASYTGLNAAVPEEGFVGAAHTTSSASYLTPTGAPQDATRWALGAFCARSTTAAETWVSAGMTLRAQAANSTTRWATVAICDTNATVAASAQSYTATLSAAESHGGTILSFLVPGTAANPAYAPPSPVCDRQAIQRAANW